MEPIRSNVVKVTDKIFFKSSVTEMVNAQTVQAIKGIMNIVDLLVEPENEKSKKNKFYPMIQIISDHPFFLSFLSLE